MSGQIRVGEPVYINGKQGRYLGICRFYGQTAFKEGVWVGVELDRAVGKNDGSVKGVRYFSCLPRHGLFAREETVEPANVYMAPQEQQQQATRGQYARGTSQSSSSMAGKHRGSGAGGNSSISSGQAGNNGNVDATLTSLGANQNVTSFQITSSVFAFQKATNQWSELGTGPVVLSSNGQGYLSLTGLPGNAMNLHHSIVPGTKLEPNIGSDRAWVFRANDTKTGAGDVLALQFSDPMSAERFANTFDDLMNADLPTPNEQVIPPAPPAPTAPPPAPAPAPPSNSEPRAAPARVAKQAPIRKQRRRLSVAGDAPEIDGLRRNSMPYPQENETLTQSSKNGVAGTVIGEFGGMSKKGYAPYNMKKENQDVCFMHQDPATDSMLLGVFDGHGEHGHHVSRYFQRHLCKSVVEHPNWIQNPTEAMKECMLARERELINGRSVNTQLSGTTAVFALVRKDMLTVLNSGDSRLILGVRDTRSGRIIPREVTLDHKPETPAEKARIERMGGRVWAMTYDDGIDGPARVWLKDENIPGLAMSRSLCDEVAKRAGVISDPDVYNVQLTGDVVFLCMATDGLWEFMSNEEVVSMIEGCGGDPRKSIDVLMKESEKRWRREEEVVDDTSIIIAYLADL